MNFETLLRLAALLSACVTLAAAGPSHAVIVYDAIVQDSTWPPRVVIVGLATVFLTGVAVGSVLTYCAWTRKEYQRLRQRVAFTETRLDRSEETVRSAHQILTAKADTDYVKSEAAFLKESKVSKNTFALVSARKRKADRVDVDAKLAKKADQENVQQQLDQKADQATVYRKTEIKSFLAAKANAHDVQQQLTEVNQMLAVKANAQEVQQQLDQKAHQATVYTKTETDQAFASTANAQEVQQQLDQKAHQATVYTKTAIDQAFASKANAVQQQLDQKADQGTAYTKTETDQMLGMKKDKGCVLQ